MEQHVRGEELDKTLSVNMMELLRLVINYDEDIENTRNWFWLGWVTIAPSHYENPLYKMVFANLKNKHSECV